MAHSQWCHLRILLVLLLAGSIGAKAQKDACKSFSNATTPFYPCLSTYVDLRNGHLWCVGSDGQAIDVNAASIKPPCPNLPKGGTVPTIVPPGYVTGGYSTTFLRKYCGKKQAVDLPKLQAPSACISVFTPCNTYPLDTVYCVLGAYFSSMNCTYSNTTKWLARTAFAPVPDPTAWRPFIDCSQPRYMQYVFIANGVTSNLGGFTCIRAKIQGLVVGMDASVPVPGYMSVQMNGGGNLYVSYSNLGYERIGSSCQGSFIGFVCTFDVFEYNAPPSKADVLGSLHSMEFCAVTSSSSFLTVTIHTRIF